MEYKIKVPTKLEMLIVKIFGKKYRGQCMDAVIEGYYYKGKAYITKNYIDPDWKDS